MRYCCILHNRFFDYNKVPKKCIKNTKVNKIKYKKCKYLVVLYN